MSSFIACPKCSQRIYDSEALKWLQECEVCGNECDINVNYDRRRREADPLSQFKVVCVECERAVNGSIAEAIQRRKGAVTV